jgi:hypothetical protein
MKRCKRPGRLIGCITCIALDTTPEREGTRHFTFFVDF